MAKTLTLFCLVHGDNPADHAFSIKFHNTAAVDELKELIKAKLTPRLDNVIVNDITLWKVLISTEELSQLDRYFDIEAQGTKLSPLQRINKVLTDNPAEDHVHIVVELPPVFKTVTVSAIFERKEVTFTWSAVRRKMTLEVLQDLVYQSFKFPEGIEYNDITIKAAKDPKNTHYPMDDNNELAKLIGNDDDPVQLSLIVNTTQQPYSSYTFKTMRRIFDITCEYYESLPTFETGESAIDESILDAIVQEILLRWRNSFGTASANEATLRQFISSVLYGVLDHYDRQLRLVAESMVAGTNGRGPVDFAIIRERGYVIAGITEGKKGDINDGVGQNAVQLESAIRGNMKKRKHDEMDGDNALFGIVSNGARWVITKVEVLADGKATLSIGDKMDQQLPIGDRDLTAAILRGPLEQLMRTIKWCLDQQLPHENCKRSRRKSPPKNPSSATPTRRTSPRLAARESSSSSSSRASSRGKSPVQDM